eukprot:scaffold171216_cov35-Attheya_sp.AAC.3
MIQLKTVFITKWVKGHQKPKEGEELPWEATLNIEADDLANEARDETAGQGDNFYQYPVSQVMLYIARKANYEEYCKGNQIRLDLARPPRVYDRQIRMETNNCGPY